MNKTRRKAISDIGSLIESTMNEISGEDPEVSWPDVKAKLTDYHSIVEGIRDEEQEYLDNMPEGLKNGDKGDTAQNAIDSLETAMDKLEEAETAADDEAPDADEVTGAMQEAIDSLGEAEC